MIDATIKDIAKLANVSYATVSRALNNKRGVKGETGRKIRKIAAELDYRPNAIARGLVKKQTHTIGLIIPDITNPFFPEVARGIEDGARDSGYSVFLCNTNWEIKREILYLNLLAEKRVDGIIIAPISNQVDFLEKTLRGKIPVVYVSNAPRNTKNSFVVIDSIRGGFLATRHLIESGYKSIGFIGAQEDLVNISERLEGYKLALKEYGMEIRQEQVRFGDFKRETGYRIIQRMIEIDDYPRAVFAENDLLALGVIQGVKEMGLSVPEDIAVVGFDDIPFAAFPEVQLTTISQPKYEMGKSAVEIVLAKIEKRGPETPARRIVLEPELIIRRSSRGGINQTFL